MFRLLHHSSYSYVFFIVCLVSLLCNIPCLSEECVETFTIDSIEYRVSNKWCGRAVDSTKIAEPTDLVRLPDEHTFENYRIYVLPETKAAFVKMTKAARRDSIDLIADSGFRSVAFQERIIRNRLLSGESMETILLSVSPPGYSEHHTGLALDLVPSEARFAHTKSYGWLREHASRYGFVETYPEPVDSISPWWESWHWCFCPDK